MCISLDQMRTLFFGDANPVYQQGNERYEEATHKGICVSSYVGHVGRIVEIEGTKY